MNLSQHVVQHVLLPLMEPVDVAHLACTSRTFRSDTHADLADIRRGSDILKRMRQFVTQRQGMYDWISMTHSNTLKFLESMTPRGTAERLLGSDLFGAVADDMIHPLFRSEVVGWFDNLLAHSADQSVWSNLPLLRKWRKVHVHLESIDDANFTYNIYYEYIPCMIRSKQFKELLMTDSLPH